MYESSKHLLSEVHGAGSILAPSRRRLAAAAEAAPRSCLAAALPEVFSEVQTTVTAACETLAERRNLCCRVLAIRPADRGYGGNNVPSAEIASDSL